jgi:ABC-type branched-subunit amino acid transport system substrate-binding protein
MRVAFVRPKSQWGLSMGEVLAKSLSFNGRPALANGEDFIQLVYDDPSAADARPDYTAIVARLVETAPHVVLYAGQDELGDNVLVPAERAWRERRHRAQWVGLNGLVGADLLSFIGKDAERRKRFYGLSTPETSAANSQLAAHYTAEFSQMSVNDTPAAAYDAGYLVAYAATVIGREAAAGPALATAIGRLVPKGAPVDVGPTHIFEAIEVLRRGENIDLEGANTKLDFDLATGESPVDWVVQCVGLNASGASDAIESGLRFDSAEGRLRGTLRCL